MNKHKTISESLRRVTESPLIPKILYYLYTINGTKKVYSSSIGYDLRITQSHMFAITKKLIGFGLLTRAKKGRIIYISLTEKGKKVANKIYELNELLK